jgi:hypothetical protein
VANKLGRKKKKKEKEKEKKHHSVERCYELKSVCTDMYTGPRLSRREEGKYEVANIAQLLATYIEHD